LKRSFLTLCICGLLSSLLFGQLAEDKMPQNIVPNPSFEDFSGTPIGWYYKGAHFDNVMQFWNSPTMYGCSNGKPHCREYVQIQLEEPLVVGQRYEVQYHISHLPRSMYSNNMGVYFSEKQYEYKTEELLQFTPQVQEKQVASITAKNWKKVTAEFIAETPAAYLIIGNFNDDEQTEVNQIAKQDFKFSYYYFDNISVIKKRPYVDVPEHPNELLNNKIETGEIIVLKNIFFDLNKSALLPRSHIALQDLIDLMRSKPNLRIEIRGHTDNQGDSDYNQELSFRRAESVVDFIHTRGGIGKSRLQFKGFGDSQPSSSNETLEGRQQNRRVEFLVLSQ